MNAFVTGASGFLGLYVVEELVARGDHVRALCRSRSPHLAMLGVDMVLADLRDRSAVMDACRGVDTVFHIGGIAGMGGPWRDYYEINVLGTQHIIDGCRAHGVSRLIYTSSPSVTFNGTDQEGVDESAPYPNRWLCNYAKSKAIGEQAALAANEEGLAVCSLRPHLMWGPRDRHIIPTILRRARRGCLRRIGDGANKIDTLYVENAAAAHLLAADALAPGSQVAGKAYFLSQGEPVNCWQWIDELLALANLPPSRKAMSLRTAWAIGTAWETLYWLLGLRSEIPLTRFLAAQLARSHYFDISRARTDFGYDPKISTAEGMRRLAATGF